MTTVAKKRWQAKLTFLIMETTLYSLVEIELTDPDNPLNKASRSIDDCAFILATSSESPGPEACVEVWAYAPGVSFDPGVNVKFVTLNETLSYGYPRRIGPQLLIGQSRTFTAVLSGSIYESDDPVYATLVLTQTGVVNVATHDISDCQDIPAGDPVKCVKVYVSLPRGSKDSGPDETEENASGPVVGLFIGGMGFYYPPR